MCKNGANHSCHWEYQCPWDAQRAKLKQRSQKKITDKVRREKSRGKRQRLMIVNLQRTPREERIVERKQAKTLAYVVGSRSKAKDWAKLEGLPWRVTVRGEASGARALRARR